MATWDRESFYYSGQGVVMLGERDELGRPMGLMPIANVSALTIAIEESVEEHKESQSGARGIDLRLSTETNATLTMMVESFIAENLAIALRANVTEKEPGSVTGEELSGYLGKVTGLQNIKVSSVVVKAGATTLTPYVDDSTPWDYKVNFEAGSIRLNGPETGQDNANLDTAGVAITGVSAAAQAVVSVADTSAFRVGGQAFIDGIVGTASALNGKYHKIAAIVEDTSITIEADTTGLTYTSGGTATGAIALEADYSYAAQKRVDALTQGSKQRYLRFEGLNTADDFRPVVVEVFKFQTDPLAELALINEGITGFELQGNVLADPLQPPGSSKYFKQTLLR